MRSDEDFAVIVAGTVYANVFELTDPTGVTVMRLAGLTAPAREAFQFLHNDALTSDSYLNWTQLGIAQPGNEVIVLGGPRRTAALAATLEASLSLEAGPSQYIRANLIGGAGAGLNLWTPSNSQGTANLYATDSVALTALGASWFALGSSKRLYLPIASGVNEVWLGAFDGVNSAPAYTKGPVLGGGGFVVYADDIGSYRMGFRNDYAGVRYLWNSDFTMLGTAPNDSLRTHTLRVAGTTFIDGTLGAGGAATLLAGLGVTGNTSTTGTLAVGGTGVNVSAILDAAGSVYGTKSAGSNWFNANLVANATTVVSGTASVGLGSQTGTAAQIRLGPSVSDLYFRNTNDSGFVTLQAAAFTIGSLLKTKKYVKPWQPDALDIIGKLDFHKWVDATQPKLPLDAPLMHRKAWHRSARHVGVMVDQLEELEPMLVNVDDHGDPATVDLYGLVSLALVGIKQQSAVIAELRSEVADLRAELALR